MLEQFYNSFIMEVGLHSLSFQDSWTLLNPSTLPLTGSYCASLAVRHFRYMLEGRKFHIQTDHKPLIHALRRVLTPWSARQTRQLAYIAEYTSDICHVPGVDNVVADTLSRPNFSLRIIEPKPSAVAHTHQILPNLPHIYSVQVPAPPPGINYQNLAAQQRICPSVIHLSASTTLKIVLLPVQNVQLLCEVSTGTPCPVVPDTLRKENFSSLHEKNHSYKADDICQICLEEH